MDVTRRRFVMNTLFGAGLVGLRSLATGIPISVLSGLPRSLQARTLPLVEKRPPQFVILQSSGEGDPINANAPGMYLDPRIGHPAGPELTPTPLMLDGKTHVAARPWSQLPQPLLDRTCFFQHTTNTVIHADESEVAQLMGSTSGHQMFASMLASKLGPALGTIQNQPIVLGPRVATENLIYEGSPQPILSPSALALMLGSPGGPLGQLQKLRDRDLKDLSAALADGTPAQRAFIDQYIQSQSQLRSVSDSLLSSLAAIKDDTPESQIRAALVLIRMNVAPVVSIHIPFGADNHSDIRLWRETRETVSGVAALGFLWSEMVSCGYQDRVSFLSMNVFGRTLSASTSADGRQHNGNHHMAIMFGRTFKGGVIGGVEPVEDDFGAMSIDPVTGAGIPGGKGRIQTSSSLQSMSLTFGGGVGVDPGFLSQNIKGGLPVPAALRS